MLAFLHLLFRQKSSIIGAVLVGLLVFVAVAAPLVSSHDPLTPNVKERLQPPGAGHLFGTDTLGRDILSRVIWGSRVSLYVGLISVGFATIVGGLMGLFAGYYKGAIDSAVMRFTDILLSIPSLVLALGMVAALGPGIFNAMLAIGISSAPTFARVIRAEVLKTAALEFIVAARATGARTTRILFVHIVPNILAPVLILATIRLATAILVEASLSFLGLGVQPPTPAWGSMISEGRRFLLAAPWMSLVPGFATMLAVMGFNLLGDGLRDALDPKLRQSGS